jgi:hypothetical protein
MFQARVRAGLAGLVLMFCAAAASAQSPDPFTATVNGQTVVLNWAAVPGATGYLVEAMPLGGAVIVAPVGNVTTVTLQGIPLGTYLARVRGTAGQIQGPASQPITIVVAGTPPPPPPPPSNLAAIVNNTAVALTWTVPAGVANVFLQAGTQPGGSELGTFPMGSARSLFLSSLPPNSYFIRLFSLGAGGPSAPSTELTFQTPGCVAPAVLPLTATTNGGFVELSWPQVPGAVGYRLDVSSAPAGGADFGSFPFPGTATGFSTFGIPEGDYYLTLHTTMSCGQSASSAVTHLKVTKPVRLPAKSLGHAESMVLQAAIAVANSHRGDFLRSCGNNTWLFRVVQRLRSQDDRFGLNWKRGNVGDLSQDVIAYNHSNVPDDQATARHTYGWDVIGNHCGRTAPYAKATNITNPNGQARFALEPYFRAGFKP